MSSSSENQIINLDDSDIGVEVEVGASQSDDDANSVELLNNNNSADLASSPIEFVAGSRSDSNLLYIVNEEQLYQKCTKHKRNLGYWYRCNQKKKNNCPARVFYDFGSKSVTKQTNTHNHDSQKAAYTENKLKEDIKAEVKKLSAVTSTSTNVSEIFYRQCRR